MKNLVLAFFAASSLLAFIGCADDESDHRMTNEYASHTTTTMSSDPKDMNEGTAPPSADIETNTAAETQTQAYPNIHSNGQKGGSGF